MTGPSFSIDRVRAALRGPWRHIEIRPGLWHVRHDAHPETALMIAVLDGWLSMDASVGGDIDDWSLLEKSSELPRPWKVVRSASSGEVRLCAELVWSEIEDEFFGDGPGWLATALDRFSDVLTAWSADWKVLRKAGDPESAGDEGSAGNGGGDGRPRPGPDPADAEALAALAAEAGWQADEGLSEVVSVALPGLGFRSAHIRRGEAGGVLVGLALGSLRGLPPQSLQATAHLALRVLGMVRLVRGIVCRDGADTELRLEVAIGAGAVASDLHHALSALTVASRLLAREMAILRDEHAAETYLAAVAPRRQILVAHSS